MMEMSAGALLLTRHCRSVQLQRITTNDRYLALVGCGVRESIAAAIVAKLIVVRVRM
jgi:hypothetical protein